MVIVAVATEERMSFKDILVLVDMARGHEDRLRIAAALAQRQGAHLVGLAAIEPLPAGGLIAPAGIDLAEIEAARGIHERYREVRLEAAARLEALFVSLAEGEGVSHEWRLGEGAASELVTLHGRYADLVIVGQSDPDALDGPAVPDNVVLALGRPLLIIPYVGAPAWSARRVLVAWNASREASRAVHDALPLLKAAEAVTILAVNPERGIGGEGDLPAADIALHLARHGIKAEAAHTVAEDVDVEDIILSRAADFGSDLMVMGGYGHSRLRELTLGGVTRSLLRHMTVPVLMSH